MYGSLKLQAADDTASYEEINSIMQNKETVIIRNLNCPNVDWILMHRNQEGKRLIEMAENAFLRQIFNQQTQENNILDLVLVTDHDLIRNCEVGVKLSSCNHHLIRFYLRKEYALTDNMSTVSDYKEKNFNLALQLLPHTEWERLDNSPIDNAWSIFKDKLP